MSNSESDYYSCEELVTPVPSPVTSPPPSRPGSDASAASAAPTVAGASEKVRVFVRRCARCRHTFKIGVTRAEVIPKLCATCARSVESVAILQKTCAWCNKTLYSNDPLCFACWQTFKIKPRSMLARPKARNASAAALQVSLNIPIKSKPAPEPEPEPAPTPEAEVEPESPRKSEIDAANAALRIVLVEMHEREAARRECSQVLDALIAKVEQNVEKEAARAYREQLEIKNVVIDLIERVEQEVADQAARRAHFASQLAAEMVDDVMREAAADIARDVFVKIQVPVAARRDVGAWSHTQPPGTAIVRGYNNVNVRVNAQDVARACGLNVHAPVFVPTANSLFSTFRYA